MSHFPHNARVLVDGRDEALVKAAFPEGSTSFLFPHYKLDFINGDQNVAVNMSRVGVVRKGSSSPRRE
jgi:4'-phosphopantetheinyl transferase EntD